MKIFPAVYKTVLLILIGLIRLYQNMISPFIPPCCCYKPTCSEYALEAMKRYGLLRGGMMSLKRILRCHPFAVGGIDEVPSLPTLFENKKNG